ncbi:putative delta-12 desaturase, partial [Aureobasidium melanogenum]
MASTTALPAQRLPVQRTVTDYSVASSSAPSQVVSPADSPRNSPSTTSLSSLGSEDGEVLKDQRGTLIDTYGNEFKIPDYTIKQIRDAIPAHCFERSAATGFYYIFRDIACIATTFILAHNFVTPEYIPSTPVRAGLWALYTVLQGLFGTGLWVIAHECGHQAFSPSKTLNDTV